jgi:hypothetical protein
MSDIKRYIQKVKKSPGGDWTDLSIIYLQVKYEDKIPTEQ